MDMDKMDDEQDKGGDEEMLVSKTAWTIMVAQIKSHNERISKLEELLLTQTSSENPVKKRKI